MMDKAFYGRWFQGLTRGLEQMSGQARSELLACCGRACSESYSLSVYRVVRERAENCDEFFDLLAQQIPAIGISMLEPGCAYEVSYSECLCDLHTDGMIDSSVLCECSRRSLLYNLQSVFPERQIRVELTDSILSGGECCRLRVDFDQ